MDRTTTKLGQRTATIADVARRAGVSIKTVSRVSNNEPNVRASTRAKVERAINELEYRPNPSARSLASRRSYLVGLLYDNPSSSYLVNIQQGALKATRAAGYGLIIHPCSYTDRALGNELQTMIRQAKVDGLVLTPPLSDMQSLVQLLNEIGTPYARVAPAEMDDELHGVYTNDEEVCAEMTRYLYELGHEKIGFVIGHPDHGAVLKRYDGYRRGLAACGLELNDRLIGQGYNSFDSGVQCAKKLLSLRARPSAIFASNDDMAAGVIRVAHEMGLAVPGNLSVAGFDDIPLSQQLWPALTTIRQPIAAMAATATELLLSQLDDRSNPVELDTTIPSELIIRDSTGPAKQT